MARYEFGAGIADYVIRPADGLWTVGAGVDVTFWTASVDGEQYTDLLDGAGNPVAYVISDEYGQLPRFSGPDDVFGMWADAGGGRRVWLYAHSGGKGEPGDPGAHWYFGTTGPEDAGMTPVAGDLYANTATGDLYSYTGSAWLYQVNLRGPEGPAGAGEVESVNGQTGTVLLTAGDIGAVPTAAVGAPSGVPSLDATGKVPAAQLPAVAAAPVQSVNGKAGAVTLTAADVGALATAAKGAASGVAELDATGKVPAAQLPPIPAVPGIWLPSDYGLSGWAYDLHAASRTPGDMPGEAQRLYLIGVPLRTAKTVSQIAIHVMGYDKPNSTTSNFRFGIYDSSFTLRAQSNGDQKAQLPEVHNVGGQMVKLNLSAAVSLAAGLYYVAILVKTSATTSTPYLAATNWGATATTSGAVAVSTSGVHRWLQSSATNLTALPASGALTAGSFSESTTCYWAGIV
ncbi:hypothetical protein OG909_24675 [Streptomyces sp. NBC_01754]|uniref:hypothetical protein n=1 Tax=Streptomyces sp. NBC_01754 TaxID=2975930 RepID=UPI002DD82BCB|nr:hypothetical protein [Streptomyces sp. NBC_01754]WSC95210.1 hypothetical protein OG909_24675 [Streptomyces sp. NBC_01754]